MRAVEAARLLVVAERHNSRREEGVNPLFSPTDSTRPC